ncbi:conserved hypothetical protein [Coccidioides posadasii str. Silveira]|uniref:Uncharacterized protein n=2 Tax=Coccidioides posadasii TaxID=199306 RepID=E9CTH9_COCPS|nr:conserved hypothetical protein [Coccidioides posadasii str. Silveira]KMM64336.1 hypothetical protein CPAG_00688 [Coccidioides posadasii RMSCC 3488]
MFLDKAHQILEASGMPKNRWTARLEGRLFWEEKARDGRTSRPGGGHLIGERGRERVRPRIGISGLTDSQGGRTAAVGLRTTNRIDARSADRVVWRPFSAVFPGSRARQNGERTNWQHPQPAQGQQLGRTHPCNTFSPTPARNHTSYFGTTEARPSRSPSFAPDRHPHLSSSASPCPPQLQGEMHSENYIIVSRGFFV